MENINGVINRKILLISILVLLLGLCYQVTSYTLAHIENSMAITISSSEDALIAMPDEIKLDVKKEITVVKTLIDKELIGAANINNVENMQSEPSTNEESAYEVNSETLTNISIDNGNDFYITNNMNETIDVNISLERGHIKLQRNNMSIMPGETSKIQFSIDNDIKNGSIETIISASWNGGYAEIIKEIEVDVETVTAGKMIDLRKPKEVTIPVIPVTDEVQEEITESNQFNEDPKQERKQKEQKEQKQEKDRNNEETSSNEKFTEENTQNNQQLSGEDTFKSESKGKEEAITDIDDIVSEESRNEQSKDYAGEDREN